MLGEKIQVALNKQINAEIYSSYLYLSMSAYFQSINLAGFANWMRVQAQEELVHAMKFVTEQIEEEASADEVVQKLKLIGGASGGLFMLDRELGQRVFTMPSKSTEGGD